ncbi:UDP-N-acetylmuramate dehydrogenase [soil metagenome]
MLTLPNLQQNVTIAPFTTYQIGGPADYFFEAKSAEELKLAVLAAREEQIPYFILGTGANILMSDKGFRGLVIRNNAEHARTEGTTVTAESGATIAQLIELTANLGLSGLEHYAGIPSTVGGAIWQNLHFLSPDRQSTKFIEEIVEHADVLMQDNSVKRVTCDFFQFGYDDSRLHHEEIIVLSVCFKLTQADESDIRHQVSENLKWRWEKQPQLEEFPSCGSVFKKIEGAGAGRLIEQVGLKGHQIGGIQSSPLHANFLVNVGGGTAADVRSLINLIQETVREKTGYLLETEIRMIGQWD